MSISLILLLVVTLVRLAIFAFVIYAAVQGVKALRKYNRSGEVRKEKAETRRSLGEVLKGAPGPVQDDSGVRGGVLGRQPSGGEQVGDRNGGPQHLQSAGAGEAVRRICGGAAAAGGPDGRGRKLNQTAAALAGRRSAGRKSLFAPLSKFSELYKSS